MKIPIRTQARIPKQRFWAFIRYMRERYKIYRKKEAGKKKPWTSDPILQEYRFCNVFREDDTVTIWIRDNWRIPYKKHENLWLAMCVARLINWPPTLEAIGFPEGDLTAWLRKAISRMHAIQKSGGKVFTGAYIITSGGTSVSKVEYIMKTCVGALIKERKEIGQDLEWSESLYEMWEILKHYLGIGPFIAYEIVTDLRWTRYGCDAYDINTWANAGPGAKRGLNRLLGRAKSTNINQKECLDLMILLLRKCNRTTTRSASGLPVLELREIEHSLCEFDKYERVKNGEGRPRSKYKGKAEK